MSTFLTTTLLVSSVSAYTSEFLSTYSDSLATDSSGCNGSPYVCDLGEIASRMEGMFWCNNSGGTLTYTHMKYTCNSDGSWTKQVASPSYCDFENQWQCWSPSNNCAVSPSSNCDQWCTCGGSTSSTAFRLGSALGSAQAPQQALGHGRPGRCPTWLPAAQNQLTGGAVIPCIMHNRICKYSSYGMNFVCTNTYGFYSWALQGPAPTPTPAPPMVQCPSWWNIWNGKSCTCTNLFCKYNYVFGYHAATNFVCSQGQWEKQGPAPTPEPTLPPVNNADCPSASIPPKAGTYCTTIGQVCSYSNAAFTCDHNGVWQSGTW